MAEFTDVCNKIYVDNVDNVANDVNYKLALAAIISAQYAVLNRFLIKTNSVITGEIIVDYVCLCEIKDAGNREYPPFKLGAFYLQRKIHVNTKVKNESL